MGAGQSVKQNAGSSWLRPSKQGTGGKYETKQTELMRANDLTVQRRMSTSMHVSELDRTALVDLATRHRLRKVKSECIPLLRKIASCEGGLANKLAWTTENADESRARSKSPDLWADLDDPEWKMVNDVSLVTPREERDARPPRHRLTVSFAQIREEEKKEQEEAARKAGEVGEKAEDKASPHGAKKTTPTKAAEKEPEQEREQAKAAAKPKPKKKKPMLSIAVEPDPDDEALGEGGDDGGGVGVGGGVGGVGGVGGGGGYAEGYEFSQSGTINVKGFEFGIRENGIRPGQAGAGQGQGQGLGLGGLPMRERLVKMYVIGAGAASQVWKALDLSSMRLVALKEMLVHDESKRRQIGAELRVLYQNLSDSQARNRSSDRDRGPAPAPSAPSAPSAHGSKTLIEFHDAFAVRDEAKVCLMVEYMDGGSLQDIVDAGGCGNESVLANVGQQVLLGLRHLHEHCRVMHRDIKPANLLIDSTGKVKISDFGIVRVLDDEDSADGGGGGGGAGTQDRFQRKAKMASTFCGTLTYMSPERLNGAPYSFGGDVWSLGLSLLTCALGRYPFRGRGGGGGGGGGSGGGSGGSGPSPGGGGAANGAGSANRPGNENGEGNNYWSLVQYVTDELPERVLLDMHLGKSKRNRLFLRDRLIEGHAILRIRHTVFEYGPRDPQHYRRQPHT